MSRIFRSGVSRRLIYRSYHTSQHGKDIAAGDYNSEIWWRTAGNWSTANSGFVWNFDNIWEWGATNLPILRNMPEGVQNPAVRY